MENGKCVKINLFHILKAGFKKIEIYQKSACRKGFIDQSK